MGDLGERLRRLRGERDRSRRWVERQSRARHPGDKERHVSHSYLRQMEEGMRQRPNPLKLLTLAEIYEVEYADLMSAAGYLCSERSHQHVPGPEEAHEGSESLQSLVDAAKDWLEGNGVHFSYLLRGLTGLSRESLALVSRLVTTLSIQEKQLKGSELAGHLGRDPAVPDERPGGLGGA